MNTIPFKSKIEDFRLFKVSRMKEMIKPTKPHKHAGYFELIFLSKGSGTHSIDDKLYQINAPTVFFLRPNQTHCWDFSSIPKGYVILFKEEIFSNQSIRYLLSKMPAFLPLKQDDFLEILFAKLVKFDTEVDIFACYINVLLHHILEGLSVSSVVMDDVLFQYQKMIDSSFKEMKSVNYYADKLNISSQKLNELSKKFLGNTAHDLIKQRIFVEAKVLLTHTQKSVKEIAMELNFSDASHFNKFFTSNSKITPGNYRKQLQS